MTQINQVAVLGAGVIGASWASLFLAAGLKVKIFDPAENASQRLREYIEQAWPTLKALGMTGHGDPKRWSLYDDPAQAVAGCQFVQESVPEQLPIKHALYQQIEAAVDSSAIVASSASGLTLTELQQGWKNPSRFLLGHPFNPPHLIPLVELLTNDRTESGVMAEAEAFYHSVGKVTIRIKKEVTAHVANRLQAALWREAIYLVESGVASVEDVDKAVWAGPGLRWAAMGPHLLFHLGAGEGGMREFCHRYADSFHRWWEDMGDARLTTELVETLAQGVAAETAGKDVRSAAQQRDELIVAMLKGTRDIREKASS